MHLNNLPFNNPMLCNANFVWETSWAANTPRLKCEKLLMKMYFNIRDVCNFTSWFLSYSQGGGQEQGGPESLHKQGQACCLESMG